jgi:hypothetical protein
MGYADQIHDHRFVRDSDPGAVERNHAIHGKATGRNQGGVAEAFGDNFSVVDDDDNIGEEVATGNVGGLAKEAGPIGETAGSVVGGALGAIAGPEGMAAGALAGGALGGELGSKAGETVASAASAGKGDDSVAGAVRAGAHAGQTLAEGKVPGVTDATSSEMAVGAGGGNTAYLSWGKAGQVTATPVVPVEPSGWGPQRNENESWNAAQIFNNTKIGG